MTSKASRNEHDFVDSAESEASRANTIFTDVLTVLHSSCSAAVFVQGYNQFKHTVVGGGHV